MLRQFTATAYILHEDKVLLHYHEKLKAWLPPGGHMEENETPPMAVRREVKEETGLDLIFIEEEHVKIDAPNAKSLERPFLCLLENIPAHKDQPAHQHIDFIYLAKPVNVPIEIKGFRWFKWEELQELDLLPDVQKVLHYLYQTH
jgi:8-oxo-dGTP pyrophosphatase MutT (NUDIX family)